MMKGFQNPRMWDYIAVNAKSDIERAGWYHSFDGKPFSEQEMEEYIENTCQKVKPFLSPQKTVLEIGCASGLTMFKLAPMVKKYIGTDMGKENIRINETRVLENKISNIELKVCFANEISSINKTPVDLVIMNSVCQCFPSEAYLDDVIEQSCDIIRNGGCIYIGNVPDQEKRFAFENELSQYRKEHNIKVNIERTGQLWYKRAYFSALPEKFSKIKSISISDMTGTIQNELLKYRYDVVIQLN